MKVFSRNLRENVKSARCHCYQFNLTIVVNCYHKAVVFVTVKTKRNEKIINGVIQTYRRVGKQLAVWDMRSMRLQVPEAGQSVSIY